MPALGPDLTVSSAAEQRTRLQALLAEEPAGAAALQLDLSGITDIDSAGVQLLLATKHTLAERGRSLQLRSPSSVVTDALATFGLGAVLPICA
jgi:anti-anti-sigma factor